MAFHASILLIFGEVKNSHRTAIQSRKH